MQKEDVHIDIAINQLKGFIFFPFESHRENAFISAMISAKEIASEMEIEPKFHEQSIICRKKINLMKILVKREFCLLKSLLELIILCT